MINVKSEKNLFSTKKMVLTAMLGAICIILGSTPLGFIPIGPVRVTIMHIPVIIGAILEGPLVGAIVGLMFGGFSIFQALTQPTPISFVFLNPLVSILPRVLIGLVSAYLYMGLKKVIKNDNLATAITGGIGTLTNTVGVLSMIYLLYGVEFVSNLGGDIKLVGKFILTIGLTNGIPEIILAIFVVAGVCRALRLVRK